MTLLIWMTGIGGVDGAIVVDLRHFQQFSMDESTWNATIGAGSLLGDVTNRLYAAGKRAMAHGVCPQVGAGGHFTIGGFGPMSRMWGTALDHVLSVQVVLADGRIVQASDNENENIFFTIKGAAASFGIVTEFTVRTHPAPGSAVRYSFSLEEGPFTSMAQTFKDWQEFVSNPELDRRLYTQITLSEVGMVASGTFFGTQQEFDAIGLEDIFPPSKKKTLVIIEDWLGIVANWLEDLGLHLVGGVRSAFYNKSLVFNKSDMIPSADVDKLFQYLDNAHKDTALWFLNFELQGGFTNTIPGDRYAYAHRDAVYYTEQFGIDIGRVTPTTRKFVTGINDTIKSSLSKRDWGCYPGYVDPELSNGQLAYWGSNLPRLEQLKKQLDPTDVFHNPQSVRPAGSQSASPTLPLPPPAQAEKGHGKFLGRLFKR